MFIFSWNQNISFPEVCLLPVFLSSGTPGWCCQSFSRPPSFGHHSLLFLSVGIRQPRPSHVPLSSLTRLPWTANNWSGVGLLGHRRRPASLDPLPASSDPERWRAVCWEPFCLRVWAGGRSDRRHLCASPSVLTTAWPSFPYSCLPFRTQCYPPAPPSDLLFATVRLPLGPHTSELYWWIKCLFLKKDSTYKFSLLHSIFINCLLCGSMLWRHKRGSAGFSSRWDDLNVDLRLMHRGLWSV